MPQQTESELAQLERETIQQLNPDEEQTSEYRSEIEILAGLDEAPDGEIRFEAADDDAALIEQAKQDSNAFGVLYERYVDRIYAYVYHRVGNMQEAEDLTARTFYRALDKLDSYEDRGLPFAAWLFRIAHNLVANWHRDHGRRRFLSLDRIWFHRSDSDDPEGELEKKETQPALWAAINRLPAERRDLLIYKFSSRLSNVEIGQLMDKSESAIKSLYFRTLGSLRKELESRGWGLSTTPDTSINADTDANSDADHSSGQ